MRRILPALLLTLAVATAAGPDTLGWVTGRATDRTTGEPLAGADVLVVNTELGATTWPVDSYVLALPAGLYQLEAWCHRYKPESLDATVTAGDTTAADFALWPDTLWLEQEADFRRAEAHYDSIKPILAATKWDVTLVYDSYSGRRLLTPDPALADSAAVWALRAWKSDTGTYYARKLAIEPDNGDTAVTNYLLVENGRCTAVLQRRQYGLHRVIHPDGGAIVCFRRDSVSPDTPWQEVPWDGGPLPKGTRLRLMLQVDEENRPPDLPYFF